MGTGLRPGVWAIGAALAAALAAAACTCKVAGVDAGNAPADAGGPGPDGGGPSPDSTVGGSDAGDGTRYCGLAMCDFPPPVACTFGETRCSPSTPGVLCRCAAGGAAWEVIGECEDDQTCTDGAQFATCNPPACTNGASTCSGADIRFCLQGGVFECPVACTPGETCNAATGTCSL
ncbi:MAG TPA: hypothetical protein VG389_14210 [Myxococcota bacterium]|jgi:hypothetical protein|nr:hypothetical protein [Myxococcota bacterium]